MDVENLEEEKAYKNRFSLSGIVFLGFSGKTLHAAEREILFLRGGDYPEIALECSRSERAFRPGILVAKTPRMKDDLGSGTRERAGKIESRPSVSLSLSPESLTLTSKTIKWALFLLFAPRVHFCCNVRHLFSAHLARKWGKFAMGRK